MKTLLKAFVVLALLASPFPALAQQSPFIQLDTGPATGSITNNVLGFPPDLPS